MEKLGLNEIRKKFEDFYVSKGHFARGSFPLIPKDDKSLLIINAGMAPLKPYFAGIKEPPSKRMTTCQKCIRTADIENVGLTSRHGTFFEMLGNFSFGDYFKRESITWGWEFITKELKLPTDLLWVTVYLDDDEAYNIWKDEIGVPEERIVRLGKDDNFWEIGSGPCGPCSEIYFDRGEEHGCGNPDCKPGCDCDRYVEFWNHVFTQFNNDGEGNYTELPQKNIDTGMGLERIACIMQGVDSIFDVDTIQAVVKAVEEKSGVKYESGKVPTDVSIRIITDHVRSATFMIGDKIIPGNEGRGYVLRRIIRRAARHGRKIGIKGAFLKDIVDVVIETCGGAYPELVEQKDMIKKILGTEEEKFIKTLDQGMKIIEDYAEAMKAAGETVLAGDKAFKLHDTYGFPIDITDEIMKEFGYDVDREGFEACMAEQKKTGKEDAAKKDFAWEDNSLNYLFEGETKFTGYEMSEDEGEITAIFDEKGTLDAISEGETANIILTQSPFYAKMGGQESDLGTIENDGFKAKVLEVEKHNKVFAHKVVVEQGTCKAGDTVKCTIDAVNRNNSRRNHTATHLLHQALKDVLGNHVEQAGSLVNSEALRFDFTHYEAMTKEEVAKVEAIVNEKICEFLPVVTEEKALNDAMADGATGLFEDKYGDVVRVVTIGDYSKELCGGLHVANSGQIGAIKILSESGIASGVRRIEAITGQALLERLNKEMNAVKVASEKLKSTPDMLLDKIDAMKEENQGLKKEVEEFKAKLMGDATSDLVAEGEEINGVTVITKAFTDDFTVDNLRSLSDELKAENKNLCMVFAIKGADKVTFIVSLTEDVVSRGYHAGNMIKEIAKAAGGGGGGKADMAQAGGKKPENTEAAFEVAKELVKSL